MMVNMKPSSGAHVGVKADVSQIMWQVMLAISPATAFGILCFGWPALNLFIITVLSAVFFEACLRHSTPGTRITAILPECKRRLKSAAGGGPIV